MARGAFGALGQPFYLLLLPLQLQANWHNFSLWPQRRVLCCIRCHVAGAASPTAATADILRLQHSTCNIQRSTLFCRFLTIFNINRRHRTAAAAACSQSSVCALLLPLFLMGHSRLLIAFVTH